MTGMMLVIGSEARTADDKISGYVKSVVVDRGTRTVTHLVVEPTGREGLARLVRLDDRVDAQDSTIRLGYTEAEFKNLTAAEDALAEVLGSGPVELIPEGWRPADDESVVDGSKISPARAMDREKSNSFLSCCLPRRRNTTATTSMPPTVRSGNSARSASTRARTR